MHEEAKTKSDVEELISEPNSTEDKFFGEDTEETPSEETEEQSEKTKEEDTAADSSSESEDQDDPSQKGDNTSDEEHVPFHKHPRWQKLQQEKEEERKRREELESKIENLEKSVQQPEGEEMPKWFAEAFGTDERAQEAFKEFKSQQQQDREQLKQEILQEQQRQQQKEQEEQQKWTQWVEESVATLQDEGYSFDRNELLDVALEYRPEDDDGNISLRKAYDILQLKKASKQKESSDKKKEVASKTESDNRGSDTQPQKPSPQDLRRKDWRTLVRDLGV